MAALFERQTVIGLIVGAIFYKWLRMCKSMHDLYK